MATNRNREILHRTSQPPTSFTTWRRCWSQFPDGVDLYFDGVRVGRVTQIDKAGKLSVSDFDFEASIVFRLVGCRVTCILVEPTRRIGTRDIVLISQINYHGNGLADIDVSGRAWLTALHSDGRRDHIDCYPRAQWA